MTTIALLSMLGTHEAEAEFLANIIRTHGAQVILIDTTIQGFQSSLADISVNQLLESTGTSLDQLCMMNRIDAVRFIIRGGREVVLNLFRKNQIHGIISFGSGTETTISTGIMRVLPIGFPKVMISTVASGNTRPYVDISDITMIHSIADILSLNGITRRILSYGASSVCAMAQVKPNHVTKHKGVIGLTRFGVTTTSAVLAKNLLEQAGYEVIVFPTVGTGGRAMEAQIAIGTMDGIFDLTTTELADELAGGIMSAGLERLQTAARLGVPQVVAPGAIDIVNFGQIDTIPKEYFGRRFYAHSPDTTLMRTSPEENQKLGRIFAERLNASRGNVVVMVPSRGFSSLSVPGEVFHNPVADQCFVNSLRENISDRIPLEIIDADINSAEFTNAAINRLLSLLSPGDGP